MQMNADKLPPKSEGISGRITALIKELGLSQNQFAKRIGTSSALVSQVALGKDTFRVDLASKIISTFPSVNALWLLTGTGEMFNPGSRPLRGVDAESLRGVNKMSAHPPQGKNGPSGGAGAEKGQKEAVEESTRKTEGVWYRGATPIIGDEAEDPAQWERERQARQRRVRQFHKRLDAQLDAENPALGRLKDEGEELAYLLQISAGVAEEYLVPHFKTDYQLISLGAPVTSVFETFSTFREAALAELDTITPHAERLHKLVAALREFLQGMKPYDEHGLIDDFTVPPAENAPEMLAN